MILPSLLLVGARRVDSNFRVTVTVGSRSDNGRKHTLAAASTSNQSEPKATSSEVKIPLGIYFHRHSPLSPELWLHYSASLSGLRTVTPPARKPSLRRKQVAFMPSLNSGLRLALVGFTHITQSWAKLERPYNPNLNVHITQTPIY
jgi:hypothetical protein